MGISYGLRLANGQPDMAPGRRNPGNYRGGRQYVVQSIPWKQTGPGA